MWKQLIGEAVNSLLPVIATVLSLGVAWLGKTLNSWLSTKVKNERFKLVIHRLGEVVSMVVLELQQTEVSALKLAVGESSEGGRKITKEEGEALLVTAVAKVKTYLGKDGLKLLCYVVGLKGEDDMNSFLISRIEATIHSVKSQTPALIKGIAEPIKIQPTAN